MDSSSNLNSNSFNFGEEKFSFDETMAMGSGTSTSTVYAGRLVGSSPASTSSSSSSSSSQSKRPGRSCASQGPPQQPIGRCQVEGCGVDLSGAKAYYCKHRVCGPHSKAPRVVVGGIEQRFCQQCSRFQVLSEFDQGKRSCRRRLAGHNERRRKPPSGPLSHARPFSPFFQDLDGTGSSGFVMDFTRPTTTAAFVSNQQPRPVIPSLPQIGTQPFMPTSAHQQFLSSHNQTLNLADSSNSGRALSLLSSPVQWGRPTGDSVQGPFSFRPLNEENPASFNHGYTSANAVHAQQHAGLDMMETRPVTETVQYPGHLGSTLHVNSESIRDGNTRNYEHGDGSDGHDMIHWSL